MTEHKINNNFPALLNEFKIKIIPSIDFEKFNLISLSHHSTAIEGSSLTEKECQNLILYNQTAKGKPFSDHVMVSDHYKALLFILEQAKNKTSISEDFIKKINSIVMKNLGGVTNTMLGSFDSSKGDYRLLSVHAGNHYFYSYDKVPILTEKLCNFLNEKNNTNYENPLDIYKLAFLAHYELVSIHPFADGNGRTSRLLMNYILAYHNQPLAIVFKENKANYIDSLNLTREKESITFFNNFMFEQQMKYFKAELLNYKNMNKGMSFVF